MANAASQSYHSRLTPGLRKKVRAKMLHWYDINKRQLPWRDIDDPYRIWISEVMLQQTRTETVLTRYSRFLSKFRSIASLADAPLEAVLSEWQGLGYYNRARNLHRAAQFIVENHGGKLPSDRDLLAALPGFGPYMTGAITSIAFGKRMAAVDGNVVRVLSRLLDFEGPANETPGKRTLEKEAETLVSPSRPGDFNQGMMDLGATICLPRSPRCKECPIARECRSYSAGTTLLRPVKTKKSPPKHLTVFQLWAKQENRIRMVRRKENGLFGGMWELPGLMEFGRQEHPNLNALGALCRDRLGPKWRTGNEITRISRTLTHRKILFILLEAIPPKRKSRESLLDEESIWANEEDLASLPISTAQRVAIQAAKRAEQNSKRNPFPR